MSTSTSVETISPADAVALDFAPGQGGMVPAPGHLPDVLPTDRLNARAKPQPVLRERLRRIPNVRNAANVVGVWLQSFGVIAIACWIDHPVAWIVAFAL